jgi:mannitol 2-dehydrogenase
MDHEAIPTLPAIPGTDLGRYEQTLIERLRNPEINDTIARLATDGSDRLPKWMLPVVRHQLAAGGPVRYSAAIVASWARYMEGIDEHGREIEVVDRHRDRLTELARRQREDPLAFISNRELFGDLAEHDRFVEPYVATLRSLHERGARATLQRLSSQS